MSAHARLSFRDQDGGTKQRTQSLKEGRGRHVRVLLIELCRVEFWLFGRLAIVSRHQSVTHQDWVVMLEVSLDEHLQCPLI